MPRRDEGDGQTLERHGFVVGQQRADALATRQRRLRLGAHRRQRSGARRVEDDQARASARSGAPSAPAPARAHRPTSPRAARGPWTSGTSSRSASSVTPPGRSTRGGSLVRSSTVDSTPTSQGPASSRQSMRPSRSAKTCAARRRAGVHEAVGARRRDGHVRRAQQRPRHRMPRHAHADGGAARRDGRADRRPARQDQRQRSRPEALGQSQRQRRNRGGDGRERGGVGDVDDQRIAVRSLLRGEDALNRGGIRRVGAQAVDRLGGEGDEAARAQQLRGAGRWRSPARRPARRRSTCVRRVFSPSDISRLRLPQSAGTVCHGANGCNERRWSRYWNSARSMC